MAKTKKMPELRFKGFTDEWEEKELGEVGETYTGLSGKSKIDFGHGNAKYITYMNVFSNPIARPTLVESIEIDNSQNTVKIGDVFFTTSSETPEEVGMSSVLLSECINTYLNSFCFGYRPANFFDNNYLAYMLRSHSVREKIVFLAQGISRYNISKNRVMEIAVPIPNIEEQAPIGSFFQNLDSLIALHQRKHDKLCAVKKAMLEKMFPKEGADVPEIRFKGFSGKWERRKLGEEKDVRDGTHASPQYHSKGHPLVTSKNLSNTGLDLSEVSLISDYDFNEINKRSKVDIGDIIFGMIGTIGNPVIVNREDIAIKNVALIKKSGNVINEFLIPLFKSNIFNEYIRNEYSGSTQTFLGLNKIRDFKFLSPKHDEQLQIGSFFQYLDSLVSLHQHELDKLKNIKKACLEKMFV